MRRVLVTGMSGGIGGAIALDHARRGHQVVGTYAANPDGAAAISDAAAAEGLAVSSIRCDVTNADSVSAMFSELKRRNLLPEVLVNNAGATADEIGMKMSDEQFQRALETNLLGTFRVIRGALRSMVRSRFGRIVSISSVTATMGSPGQANYAASKAGLTGMTRSLAREVASRNITLNVVSPGPVETSMLEGAFQDRIDMLRGLVPMGRVGTVEEIAHIVGSLTDDKASFVTGAVVPVDGGLGMGL